MKDYKPNTIKKELSPYNLSHNMVGENSCCGIFNSVDEIGMIVCNECGVTLTEEYNKYIKYHDCSACDNGENDEMCDNCIHFCELKNNYKPPRLEK